jgi:hypothetical protein
LSSFLKSPAKDESIAAKDTLYRCLDKLCEHKTDWSSFLKERWSELFDASYDVLLYNLISTYFECDMAEETDGLRRFGYSRDKRSDRVQVVVALIITPESFPVTCEGGCPATRRIKQPCRSSCAKWTSPFPGKTNPFMPKPSRSASTAKSFAKRAEAKEPTTNAI